MFCLPGHWAKEDGYEMPTLPGVYDTGFFRGSER